MTGREDVHRRLRPRGAEHAVGDDGRGTDRSERSPPPRGREPLGRHDPTLLGSVHRPAPPPSRSPMGSTETMARRRSVRPPRPRPRTRAPPSLPVRSTPTRSMRSTRRPMPAPRARRPWPSRWRLPPTSSPPAFPAAPRATARRSDDPARVDGGDRPRAGIPAHHLPRLRVVGATKTDRVHHHDLVHPHRPDRRLEPLVPVQAVDAANNVGPLSNASFDHGGLGQRGGRSRARAHPARQRRSSHQHAARHGRRDHRLRVHRQPRLRRRHVHVGPEQPGTNTTKYTQPSLFSFNIDTGLVDANFRPTFGGGGVRRSRPHRTAPSSSSSVRFNTVNGVTKRKIASINPVTGAVNRASPPTRTGGDRPWTRRTPRSTSAASSPRSTELLASSLAAVSATTGALVARLREQHHRRHRRQRRRCPCRPSC